jgi:hypothetical protein
MGRTCNKNLEVEEEEEENPYMLLVVKPDG